MVAVEQIGPPEPALFPPPNLALIPLTAASTPVRVLRNFLPFYVLEGIELYILEPR